MSDDGRHGLTLIAFIGSVFSPYYAWARRGGACPDARNHCAVNLALYGPRGKRWAMTERDRRALRRDSHHLSIGPSLLYRDGDCLVADIDEVTVPLPSRLRGRIRVYPEFRTRRRFALDTDGLHHWWPLAPVCRVEVEMRRPDLCWQGHGYLDANAGTVPLEDSFISWDWSRAHLPEQSGGGAALLYDVIPRSGTADGLALRIRRDGAVEQLDAPAPAQLPATGWRVARGTRSDRGFHPTVARTLEDTPFYARSVVTAGLLGEKVTALHESLDLDRFRHPVVQMMLPFRMPRRA